jgi:hypothetical protein
VRIKRKCLVKFRCYQDIPMKAMNSLRYWSLD